MGSPQQYILGSEMKWTLCLLFVASVATALPTRDKKAFSLFSVVTFPNKECTTQMTPPMNGICVTADECQNSGDVVATKSGNCASGFGVCCLRTVEGNPGANINTALTYIQSPDFPAAVTALNNAANPPGVINRAFNIQGGANVCQVRFDFITGVVDGPLAATVAGGNGPFAGDCTTDVISVTTPARGANTAGIGIPALCGTLTGQHLYVDVNSLNGGAMAATLNINTAAAVAQRMWKILARCVNCNDEEYRAPSGCAQFHTGASGRISSFNGAPAVAANGQMLLNDLSYSICIRPVAGACGVTLTQANSPAPGGAAVVPDSFGLASAGNAGEATVGAGCVQSYIEVATAQSNAAAKAPRICGDVLNPTNALTTAAPVDAIGFVIGVVSDGDNGNAATAGVGTGFDLLYTQRGCP